MTINVAMTTRPTTAPLRWNNRRNARRAGLSKASESVIGTAPIAVSVMRSCPQPWIDEDIGDIGDQVQGDVNGRRYQHDGVHDRITAVEHGIGAELAETRCRKHLLGQHPARQ